MSINLKPRRRILTVFSTLLIFAFYFQALPIQLASQGLLSRLATRRASSVKASFHYAPSIPTEGQAVQFMNTSTGSPTSWQWDFGDGTASTDQNPSHAYVKAGFKKITLIARNSSSTKQTTRTMTVMPAPEPASFVFSPVSPTAGQDVQFADTTSGAPTSWQWDFGDGATSTAKNPSHAFASPSSYLVTLIASNNSGSKKGSRNITVASVSSLVASFAYNPSSPAAGQAVQFSDTSTGGPTSWSWAFGDGGASTSQSPTHAFTTTGAKTVTLTATNASGSNSTTRTVTVVAAVTASFSYSPASPAVGQSVAFTDTSVGTPTAWQWSFGDGGTSTAQNPTHAFTTTGAKTVTLTVTNASGSNSTTRTVTVVVALTASFSYSPTSPAAGQAVQFSDTSTGGPTSWQWNFNDGATSTAQNPSHAFTTTGSKTVTLTVTNTSGSNSTTRTVTVVAVLAASFNYSPTSPAAGQAVQFSDTSTGNPTAWQWNFGDGGTSTSQNPTHAFTTTGSKTVTLTVTNASGSNSATRTVSVVAALTVSFSYSPTSPAAGQSVQFTDTSAGTPTSWQWNFGDGGTSTSQNPSHTFTTTGSQTVTLTVTNASGSNSATRTVTVVAALAASFSYSPTSPPAGQAVQFTDTSTGGPTSWQWNFNDGATSTAQNPSHAFTTAGTYNVTLTVSNASGSNATSRTITVMPAATLTASFSYSPTSPAAGQTVQFTDTSAGGPTSWQWNFGDGGTNTARNPSHAFAAVGSYTVTLTVRNSSGSASVDNTLSISPQSTILPAERKIDWGLAGVWENGVKGIPNRTMVFCNVRVSIPGSALVARGDGVQDDTAALQAAINACPVGQVVYLPVGMYRISTTLNLKSNMVIRGAGMGDTTILQYGNAHVFRVTGTDSFAYTNATSGYTKGSDTVVVSDPSLFQVGDMVRMDQLNDPNLVTNVGTGGTCTWCGRYGVNGTRAMGEVALVTQISGNSIKLNRSLYYTYSSAFNPQLGRQSRNPIKYCGIEDMTIQAASGVTSGDLIRLYTALYCWVKGVETYNVADRHIHFYWDCYGCEVRECYVHGANYFDGSRGYGISLAGGTYDSLIENNILYYLHCPIIIDSGGAGNVIGYNYIERTQHVQAGWFIYHMGTHGSHPFMNLFEGNVAGKVDTDSYWGSGSHNVFFRNRITRENPGQPVTSDIVAVIVEALNYYMTFVGNILGTPGCSGPVEQIPLANTYMNPVLWKIGYAGSAIGNPTDPKVAQTLIKTGNWECPTNAVQWDPNIADHTIPDSLYLTSKPAWYGILTWPPFTPERSGFNPANVNKIPAQVRFENGPAVGLPSATSRGY